MQFNNGGRGFRPLTSALLLAAFSVLLCQCGMFEDDATKRVREFADAFNASDFDRMMACVDPQIERIYKGVKGVTDTFQRFMGSNEGGSALSKKAGALPFMKDLFKEGIQRDLAKELKQNPAPMVTDLRLEIRKVISSVKSTSGDRIVTVRMKVAVRGIKVPGNPEEELIAHEAAMIFTVRQFEKEWRIVDMNGQEEK